MQEDTASTDPRGEVATEGSSELQHERSLLLPEATQTPGTRGGPAAGEGAPASERPAKGGAARAAEPVVAAPRAPPVPAPGGSRPGAGGAGADDAGAAAGGNLARKSRLVETVLGALRIPAGGSGSHRARKKSKWHELRREVSGEQDMSAVASQLARLNRNVEALASTMRAQQVAQVAPPISDMHRAYLEHAIDYTDRRPEVQVTVEIEELVDFDLVGQQFTASFRLMLDWEEPGFVEGVHYHQDLTVNHFVISNWLLDDKNSFNPRITIANAVDFNCEEDPERPVEPKIHRLVTRSKGGESVWLTKEYQFSGALRCQHVDGAPFPFDVQRLPIQVKSVPMPGLTSLGAERKVRLVQPKLRRAEEKEKKTKKKKDKNAVLRIDNYIGDLDDLQAHHWKHKKSSSYAAGQAAGYEENNLVVGELRVCAFGGSDPKTDEYHVEMVLVRDWTSYLFDFVMQMTLVIVELTSAWVPFNTDSISNKLSISLTIILAMVLLEKPAAIQDLTVSTVWERFNMNLVALSVVICVGNVFVWVQCWGMDRGGMRSDLMGAKDSWLPDSLCEEDMNLRASRFDSIFMLLIFAVILVLFIHMVLHASLFQLRSLINIKDELNAMDETINQDGAVRTSVSGRDSATLARGSKAPQMSSSKKIGDIKRKQVNRLSIISRILGGRTNDFNALASDADIAICLARHGMPMLYLLPQLWAKLAFARPSEELLACRRCRRRRRGEEVQATAGAGEIVTVAGTGLQQAATGVDNPAPDDFFEKFVGCRPPLHRDEPAHIVDCGTGEVGFYTYRWRLPLSSKPQNSFDKRETKEMVYLDCNYKHKLASERTFMEEFVYSEDGAERFTQVLVEQFRIGHPSEGMYQSPPPSAPMKGTAIREETNNLQGTVGRKRQDPEGCRHKKAKIFFGPTGQNRQTLLHSADHAKAMESWVDQVQEELEKHSKVDFLLFVPTEKDEATYELVATEWLVQRGDLDVTRIPQGKNRVPFAGLELSQALMRAGKPSSGGAHAFSLHEFVREFQDLMDTDVDHAFMEAKFKQAALQSSVDENFADVTALSEVMRSSPQLMRALVKSRLFHGTLSAGGGSCQITVKPDHHDRRHMEDNGIARATPRVESKTAFERSTSNSVLRSSEFYSVKLGFKLPLIGEDALFKKTEPMSSNLVEAWRTRIRKEIASMDLPHKLNGNLRGVFIGISAVYYAAQLAGCAECLLPKASFLQQLGEKLDELLARPREPKESKGGGLVYDHRDVSNLVLVSEIVGSVLAESAWIVCKRNWTAQSAMMEVHDVEDKDGEPLPKYVATWSLGFYLSQAM